MNAFLAGAIVVCAVQCVCLAIIVGFGERLKYEIHQAICLFGAILWFPCIALCIASAVSQ